MYYTSRMIRNDIKKLEKMIKELKSREKMVKEFEKKMKSGWVDAYNQVN